ncbi:membrane lipoprotein lipid attachment site-containing protein [Metabacillus fastidiosus]|uniref:membrane lipoprotein lipid attachment site-containing protein n=1 Tax=Metabacillus fastidiosus TaxID=1458 RepID=UPI003D2B4DEE
MKKIISIIFLILVISGCSNKGEMQGSSKSFVYEKSINFKGIVYVATSSKVKNMEEMIGSIKQYSDKEEDSNTENFSNYYLEGTKLYKIKNEDVKESIAVEIGHDKFIKAINIENMK